MAKLEMVYYPCSPRFFSMEKLKATKFIERERQSVRVKGVRGIGVRGTVKGQLPRIGKIDGRNGQ
jgi:hypothetical protein